MSCENKISPIHVLLIEDDQDIRELVSESFLAAGAIVNCCENGREGLEYLLNPKLEKLPELILVDLLMPILSGTEFIETIIKKHPKISKLPIVITSGRESQEFENSLPKNFTSVRKPIDIDELISLSYEHYKKYGL